MFSTSALFDQPSARNGGFHQLARKLLCPVLKIINGYNWRTLGSRRSRAVQRLATLAAIPVWLVALDAGIAQMQGMLRSPNSGSTLLQRMEPARRS